VTAPASEGVKFAFAGLAGSLAADRWVHSRAGDRLGTVLLLHGGGQTRHSWFRTAVQLAGAGWDAIALDARGHGDSDWASDGDYSIDALVADLQAVVEQVGEKPVLVGASMGGMTSIVGQGEHPELARALVLVDIVPRIEAAGAARIMAFMTGNIDGFATLEDAAEVVRAYNPLRDRPATAAGLRKNLRQRPDGRWYWHWDPAFLKLGDEPRRAISEARSRAAATRIRIPTLLVRGEQSDVVSPEGAAELLAMIPGSQYVDVRGTGHMVAGDDNADFTHRVLQFLQGLPSV
jgi:pimeloyl-ACP methyl ester carboxylesterase